MIRNLSVLIECSFGRCPTVEAVKQYITYISEMGYKSLYLGLTDGYKIEGEPYFNYKRGGYTTEELQEIDRHAIANGIEVIACIQTLGHLYFLRRYAEYADMYDTDQIMLVDDERVLALNEKMFAAISAGLSSRKIQIGFDETFGLGEGRYKQLHKGPIDRKVLLLRHLNRVVDIARKYGYTCEIWHDMLLDKGTSVLSAADVKRMLPEDVRVYFWDYTLKDEDKLRESIAEMRAHCTTIGYAGAALKEHGFTVANSFSVPCIIAQMKVCMEQGVEDYMVTTWTDGGGQCSLFATLPAMFVAAEYANGRYQQGGALDKARFKQICGVAFDDMWALGYLDDPFEKQLPHKTNRSRWVLETDILFGNYDMMLSTGTAERYAALAERYEAAEAGEFKPVYHMQAALARVLAIKCSVAEKIRTAYAAQDKAALAQLRDGDMAQLVQRMREFIKAFNAYWLDDSMPFGLEFNQRMFGGYLARFEYVMDMLTAYIEQDAPIIELEGVTLPPSLNPWDTEDTWNDATPARYMA